MNSVQRQALREALIAQGFKRERYTSDESGTGEYVEYWYKGDNWVEIVWGVRTT